ncbi:protein transport protein sec23 [Plasmodium yoelii yoelii]|uniref:Protein transport protein SEC23 n=1 Tax=Plasmodium yoelii yoelii TaxID=73239 RepID=Q7RLP4_PLAYO|nr:protein transport protein sec23 [Plasmodium yoelii yoelii]
MDIHLQEKQTGIRFSWNLWPPTKNEASKIEIPLGCLYTVLKGSDENNVKLVEYEPLKCKTSNCILNPYCNIDFRNKTWTCPFSNIKNPFPPHYAQHISEKVRIFFELKS